MPKKIITSLEDFVRKIMSFTPAAGEQLLYRGHSDRKFTLLPSVLREDKFKNSEHRILRELVASHPTEFASDSSTLEQLARVQHYSLPTRLLDVSWNPLVGLYFAVKEHDGIPGEVIVLRVNEEKVKFYDSDTASCIANLAHLKTREKDSIRFARVGRRFNKQPAIDRLLQFVRVEKPHFRPAIVPDHLRSILVIKPKLNNPRILAQSGAFLLFGLAEALDVTPAAGITFERIRINGNKKEVIRAELDRMAINDSTMFPEIEKAAMYIRDKL